MNKIKIIIGLGNPGPQYRYTRHNIGFLVLDALAETEHASWHKKTDRETTEITLNNHTIILIKPLTFMNSSGKVIPSLLKQGIKAENILVVHDELEKPFGKIEFKTGGGHHGHNGLRSIMEFCGADFTRLRCGIGRPEHKTDVANYVLSVFTENPTDREKMITAAVTMIKELFI